MLLYAQQAHCNKHSHFEFVERRRVYMNAMIIMLVKKTKTTKNSRKLFVSV